MQISRVIPMVVVCHNCAGEPDVFDCQVLVTRHQFALGGHYEKAKAEAEEHGYEKPMVAFDPLDMKNMRAWVKNGIIHGDQETLAWCVSANRSETKPRDDCGELYV